MYSIVSYNPLYSISGFNKNLTAANIASGMFYLKSNLISSFKILLTYPIDVILSELNKS